MRKAFTLVELLIVIAILGILFMLVASTLHGCNAGYYAHSESGVFQCVKTYVTNDAEGASSKRVDLRPKEGGTVKTFTVDDNVFMGVRNSATLYAQFEAGRWYQVSATGQRNEFWSHFPNVTSVQEVQEVTPEITKLE